MGENQRKTREREREREREGMKDTKFFRYFSLIASIRKRVTCLFYRLTLLKVSEIMLFEIGNKLVTGQR